VRQPRPLAVDGIRLAAGASTLRSTVTFELRSFSPTTKKLEYYYSDDIRHLDIMKLKASKEAVREIAIPNDS
jgi:hypothetical protein